jgi:hypothetical protein
MPPYFILFDVILQQAKADFSQLISNRRSKIHNEFSKHKGLNLICTSRKGQLKAKTGLPLYIYTTNFRADCVL